MDDKNVEDFFAKKDKGKKGKKSKFTGTRDRDSLAKSKDDAKQVGKDKEKQTTNLQSATEKGEDEWIDFDEPTEKDYTGLKIQTLQISEKQDTESAGSGDDENYEEGDGSSKKDNPWASSQANPTPAAQAPAPVEPKATGVYRPPSFTRVTQPRRGPRAAPEINSEIAFPSLQAATQTEKKKEIQNSGRSSFETVRHGSRTTEALPNRGPRLDLGNKFDALSNSN